jgi:hypothetical protein
MKKYSTTIIGVLLIVIIVVAVFTLMPHHPKLHSTGGIAVSQWKYSGYQDPKSAILSAAAAFRKNDGQVLVDALTPELRKEWEFNAQPAMQKNNKTLAQLIAARAPGAAADATIHIVKQQVLNDRWTLVVVKITAGDKSQTLTVVLRKIDGEWKVDDFE